MAQEFIQKVSTSKGFLRIQSYYSLNAQIQILNGFYWPPPSNIKENSFRLNSIIQRVAGIVV